MRGLLQMSIGVALVTVSLGCSASSGAEPRSSAAPKSDPDVITTAEIEAQPFRDAYDIVQRLRPTWFTRKSGASTGAGLLIYLDNARLGGVQALRQVDAGSIESLKFLDAATATATLPGIGSSVVSGAIVLRRRRGT